MSQSVRLEIAQGDGERVHRLLALLRWRGVHVDVSRPPERAALEPLSLAIRVPQVDPGVAREAMSRLIGRVGLA